MLIKSRPRPCPSQDGVSATGTCHNDNGFSYQFSEDTVTWRDPVQTYSEEECARLQDGCEISFKPMTMRYLKLVVRSGCAGIGGVERD